MQWYEKLFSNYAERYEAEHFTQGTLGEVAFLEKELDFDHNKQILDIGCGTGRHAIELTKRGYTVTGFDLSEGMLAKARENATAAGVEVTFLQRDARNFHFEQSFDLAIMLCEGAFPLMETDEMNFSILKNAANAIAEGGKFIFTTLNGLYAVKHFMEEEEGRNFDLMQMRLFSKMELQDDRQELLQLDVNERFYLPSEITWLLHSLGFQKIELFGANLGAFSRNDMLTTDNFEMLVIAEK